MQPKARLIANYLPQFHPIPENDLWWGKGFTEWTNVAKAKPLFPGHDQPRVPSELGFYDLRVPETRAAQAELARAHGIEGFCYWHYWFGGKLLLERPLEEVVRMREPDFPFCVAWANETWSGIWHGAADRVLMEQTYPGDADDAAHFRYLLPMFSDPRYIRVAGKPLFMVFRPNNLPDARRFADLWRKMAADAGLPGLHIIGYMPDDWDAAASGFDGATWAHQSVMRAKQPKKAEDIREAEALGRPPHVWPFAEALQYMHGPRFPDFPLGEDHYPSIVTGWDNSPRSGRAATILHGMTPELFALHARYVLGRVRQKPPEDRIVFVKSWNEWAEGNYLEPDLRYGRAHLEALRDAVYSDEVSRSPAPASLSGAST